MRHSHFPDKTTNIFLRHGRLGIFVTKQALSVGVYGSAVVMAIMDSCQSIMNIVNVSKEVRTFGIRGLGFSVELSYN